MRLGMKSRQEILKAHFEEYRRAGKKGRGELLDRLAATTGLNRDYLATALSRYGKRGADEKAGKGLRKRRPEGKRGGRPVKYGPEFSGVLAAIWLEFGRPCGKLPVPMIRDLIDFLQDARDPEYGITPEIRRLLLQVSPAEADILLKPRRKALEIRGVSTTRAAQTPLRKQIPVRTHFKREETKPGQFAFDTVAHCGASASGQFCKTLTGTDVHSGWIEERALPNAANLWVRQAIDDINTNLPFPMTGAHYDNGAHAIPDKSGTHLSPPGTFIGATPRHIRPSTRCACVCLAGIHQRTSAEVVSGAAHSGDQDAPLPQERQRGRGPIHAEQKNYDAVRKVVGYFRFDPPEECEALAEVYRWLCQLYNYWMPSFRLVSKEQQADGRYRKVYEKSPRTPYQRLTESPDVSAESKAELAGRKALQNPVELNRRLNDAVERLLKLNREKQYAEKTSGTEDGQAPAA